MGNQVGRNIHTLRKQQGLTQEQLADSVKVSFQAVSNGRMEFPIVKDTTPNMTNPRLYRTTKEIKA